MRGALPLTCLALAGALSACGEKPEPAIVAPRTERSTTTAAPNTAAFETSYRREVCQGGQPDREALGKRTARGVLALKDAQSQLALVPAADRAAVASALARARRYYLGAAEELARLPPPPGLEAAKRFTTLRTLTTTHAASLATARRSLGDSAAAGTATRRLDRELSSLRSSLDALGVPEICVVASGAL